MIADASVTQKSSRPPSRSAGTIAVGNRAAKSAVRVPPASGSTLVISTGRSLILQSHMAARNGCEAKWP